MQTIIDYAQGELPRFSRFSKREKKRVDKLGWHVNFDTGFDEKNYFCVTKEKRKISFY